MAVKTNNKVKLNVHVAKELGPLLERDVPASHMGPITHWTCHNYVPDLSSLSRAWKMVGTQLSLSFSVWYAGVYDTLLRSRMHGKSIGNHHHDRHHYHY